MKKTLSLLLALCMALALCVPAMASGEASGAADIELLAPSAYTDASGALTDSVVNGYYAETAPILVISGDEITADAALAKGYVVVKAAMEDIADTVAYLKANDDALPGDSGLIVAVASGAQAALAAQYAVNGELYAAALYDPAVAGLASEDALEAAYNAALTAYLLENYQSSRQDGPNIVYTIDEDGARAYAAENAAGYDVDYATLEAAARDVDFGAMTTADKMPVDPAAGRNAEYFYIRGNSEDMGAASAALALGETLKAAGDTVNCAVSWGAESESALYDWIERVCKYENAYTPAQVETLLDLANGIAGGTYAWKETASAYTIAYVTAVANPELVSYEGLSVGIPAEYIAGIDEDGNLIIDWEAQITSPNGAVYTAATAPIIINTGAAGYSSQTTSGAGSSYGTYGYITVNCGNRGKNNVCVDAEGNSYYTGDAPYCLVDQKAVVRWLKYNIALGNLCGDPDRIVSTGGSGGGAHSLMLAAMGNHPDFYPYLCESGAVGAYYDAASDSYYSTVSDAIWGCCPYSPITNLEEQDMACEWEALISLTALDYIGASEFKRALSEKLAYAFVEYLNGLGLTYDLDGDGSAEPMTLNADGVSGSYVDFLVAQAESDLAWFLDHIDSVNLNVTWQNENGESQAEAYFYGHYDYTQSIDGLELSGYDLSEFGMTLAGSEAEGWTVSMDAEGFMSYRSRMKGVTSFDRLGFLDENGDYNAENLEFGNETQDYRHWDKYLLAVLEEYADELAPLYAPDDTYGLYASYEDMVEAFRGDVAIIEGGDEYYAYTGKTIVELYNPLRYILDERTEQPKWARIVHGTQDKDVSLAASQNDAIAWTMMGVDTYLAWGWDNVHVADDPLDTSKTSFIDAMAMLEDGLEVSYPITNAAEPAASGTASGGPS